MSSDPGGGAKIDEETLTSTIRTYLERITRVEDPRDMKGLKRIYRRNVPLHLRGYFAAYLLRELAGSAPAPAGRLARLFINAGRNRRVFPKDLYDLFTSQLKIPRSEIGEVRVLDNYSFVEIQPRHADRAIAELTGKEFRGRKLSVNYARPREDKKRE